ncbi:MAG: GNAT family N-acetyltransferase [Chloroflexota bacterium]
MLPFDRLNTPTVPTGLRQALDDLAGCADPLLQAAPRRTAARLRRLLAHLVDEVINPDTPLHYWEMTLDLLNLAAAAQALPGGPAAPSAVSDAAATARAALADYFGPYGPVTLEPITMESVRPVCWLSDTLREPQVYMVAPNVMSLAEANFHPHAWFRAIQAGKALVGFMMIVDDPHTPEYFLWRFMIAPPFQGRGWGAQAIQRLVEYVRTRPGARELGVSCDPLPHPGSPQGFYERLGFVSTGEMDDDELVLKMPLG